MGGALAAAAFAPAGDPCASGFRAPPLGDGAVQLWSLPHAHAEDAWRALLAAHAGPATGLALAHGAHGKPLLPGSGLEFSVSRAHERVLFALARGHQLGVDLEWLARRVSRPEGLLRRCFAPDERAAIASAPDPGRALLEAWCAKEAVVKGIGRGIAFGLRRVALGAGCATVHGDSGAERWWLHALEPWPGYVGALACRERGLRIEAWRVG